MSFFPALELIDRLCIARLKWEKTSANQEELLWYETQWAKFETSPEVDQHIKDLTEIHRQIWAAEWQLKTGVEHELTLEEIGRRAIASVIALWPNAVTMQAWEKMLPRIQDSIAKP